MMEQRWCVYFLRDPRNLEVRYVGCTSNKQLRTIAHGTASWNPLLKRLWTAELRICKLRPLLETIQCFSSHEAAIAAEKSFIIEYQRQLPGTLTNRPYRLCKDGAFRLATLEFTQSCYDLVVKLEQIVGWTTHSLARACRPYKLERAHAICSSLSRDDVALHHRRFLEYAATNASLGLLEVAK